MNVTQFETKMISSKLICECKRYTFYQGIPRQHTERVNFRWKQRQRVNLNVTFHNFCYYCSFSNWAKCCYCERETKWRRANGNPWTGSDMSEREFMTKCAMGQASTIGATVLNPFKPTFFLLRNILLYTHCCQEAELLGYCTKKLFTLKNAR